MVDTDAADATTSQSPTIARSKRSRTGCLTCRTRRRKCDETRPICQNCISKGLECRYSAAFQILGKNNFTPEVDTTVKYTNVQFVGPGATQSNTDLPAPNVEQSTQSQQSNRPCTHSTSPDNYEVALRGLLELGSGDGIAEANRSSQVYDQPTTIDDAGVIESLTIDPVLSTPFIRSDQESGMVFGQLPRNPSNAPYTPNTRAVGAVSTPASLEGDIDTLELLKYYRYQVAPWLDMYDSEQCFGVELVTLASNIRPLREVILAIAEQAQGSGRNITLELLIDKNSSGSTSEYAGILGALQIVVDIFKSLAHFWHTGLGGRDQEVITLLLTRLYENKPLHNAAYWLSIRLLLSRALLSTEPIDIPLPPFQLDTIGPHINSPIIIATEAILSLCADALTFSHGAESSDRLQKRYILPRVEIWTYLIDAFAKWYMSRTQALQPIIELYPKDGLPTPDDFPSIVFTNSGAVLVNQLYHTGMLLLLQHRPRFASQPISNSSSMSVLWHAHRICGIAKQIADKESWDPCSIAGLIIASKTITHAGQHASILWTLQSAQRMTGWDIQEDIDRLEKEWQDGN